MRIKFDYVTPNSLNFKIDTMSILVKSTIEDRIFRKFETTLMSLLIKKLNLENFANMLERSYYGVHLKTDNVYYAYVNGQPSYYYTFIPHRTDPDRERQLAKHPITIANSIEGMLSAFTPMDTLQLSHHWKPVQAKLIIGKRRIKFTASMETEAWKYVFISEEGGRKLMEYGCFFENEPIMTLNGSKKIKDITPSDYVYSNGNFLPVRATQKRFHSGAMVGFYLISTTDQLVATPNHPFLAYSEGEFKWKQASELTFNDKLAVPIPKNMYAYKDMTKIGELLEYQVYGKSIGVGVISYRKEPKYAKNYKKDGDYFVVEDLELWKRVHAYKYELPSEYLLLSKKNKKFIVNYYYNTITKQNNKGVSFAFLSSALAYQFQLILASLNVDSKIFGKFKSKKYAIVSIRKEVADFLMGKTNEFEYRNIEFVKGYMLVPIQTVFQFNFKGNVYNIEIDNDDDDNKVFVVKNVLVHNSYLNRGVTTSGKAVGSGGEYFAADHNKTAHLVELALYTALTQGD